MSFHWGWVIPAGLAVAVVLAGSVSSRTRRRGSRRAVQVANTDALTGLSRYRLLARRHRRNAAVMGVASGVLVIATVMLSARPVRSESVPPEIENRDIMLCLDVSGSMAEYNRSVIEQYAELVGGFEGQRVGLTIFNASAVTVFPLTTDYHFVTDEFERFRQTFAERGIDTLGGTLEGEGSSLVPDGIASCALGFPEEAGERSRSIIVATDNEVEGSTLLSMPEVTTFIADRTIQVYAIFPLFEYEDPDRPDVAEIRALASTTDGAFFPLEDTSATARILRAIERTEVTRLDAEPQLVEYATPAVWLAVAALALLALVGAAWRARL